MKVISLISIFVGRAEWPSFCIKTTFRELVTILLQTWFIQFTVGDISGDYNVKTITDFPYLAIPQVESSIAWGCMGLRPKKNKSWNYWLSENFDFQGIFHTFKFIRLKSLPRWIIAQWLWNFWEIKNQKLPMLWLKKQFCF